MSLDEYQQDSPETGQASQTTNRTHQGDRNNVVLIYNDCDIGFILARTVEKSGYRVDSVSYKRDTLTGLREREYRLAVLEVKMGDAEALRRLEAIRKADPGLPVVLVSGLGDSIGRILQLGVEAWIDKPFRLEEVRAAVKKFLG